MQNEKSQHLASDEIQFKCDDHGEPEGATRLGPMESSGLRTTSSGFWDKRWQLLIYHLTLLPWDLGDIVKEGVKDYKSQKVSLSTVK